MSGVISPFSPEETRVEQIARWEREGRLVPTCKACQEFYRAPCLPAEVCAPSHKASAGCESGRYPHCTCDRCF